MSCLTESKGHGRRVSIFAPWIIASAMLSGCGAPQVLEPTPNGLLASPRATATPLAVEATLRLDGQFYRPSGWDGVADVDCGDFPTQADAQSFFAGTNGSKTNDPYRLDSDNDGIACQELP